MGSLLMPLLGSVAAKTGDALVAELLRAWGLDKVRRKLEPHPAAVQSILLDVEVKSRIDPAVREWMKDLNTAAYQADDVLDDFRYEALRRRAAQLRRCSTARKVLSYFAVNSPVVSRLSMSRKMKDTLEMIDELVVEMNNFHFLQHAEAPSIVHPQTHCRWMAELKTAAYQTDDILDDFRYEALRRRAAHRSAAHKVLSYFIANSPVVFCLSMSRKMKDALEMIDELVVEMNNLFPSLSLFSSLLVAGIIRTIP